MLVGIKPREGLQDRGGHLEYQRDDAYLCKRKPILILDNRIDGRDDGLNHIVQKMGDAADDEHRIHCALRHHGVSLDSVT